ncbi:MAG: PAS domain S-box protein [Nitrospiraceae bacterium]|nr:MAG: PAS domain S-box protein [Nitrospiraceae bacterium]
MSEATAPRPYSWLPVLLGVLTVATLSIGAIAFRYVESRMIATAGETLAHTAAEVSDKLDRFLIERHGDVLMMARTFSVQPQNREFQSAYIAGVKIAYSDYIWIGATDAQGKIVVATDSSTVGRDYSAEPWFQAVRNGQGVHMGDVEPFAVMGGPDSIAVSAPITGPYGEFLGAVTTRVGIPGLEDVMTRTLLAFRQREGFWGALEYQFLTEKGIAFIDSDLEHKGNVNLKQLGLRSALLSEASLSSYVEEAHMRRHVPVITGYAKTLAHEGFEGMHWTVLMRMDRSDVLAPIREILWNLGLAGSAVVVPTFGLLVWTVTRVKREYQHAQQEHALAREAEASLRKSEAHTRRIVEMALDGFIGMDADGTITDWNAQAEQIFGWRRQEAVGRLLSATIVPPQHRANHERGLRHFLATGEGPLLNTRVEITGCHRDGHEIPIELAITPSLGQRGGYTFSAFVRDISARKQTEQQDHIHQKELQRLNEALDRRVRARTQELASVNESLRAEVAERVQTELSLESSRQALQKLTLQLLRVQEEERRRISRDLHDDINQRLALLAMDIEAVGLQLSSSPDHVGRAVQEIQDRVVELSDVVRHLAYQLHPSILDDLGLPIALQRLVDDFTARSRIRGSFGHKNIPPAVPQEIASCLYRVAQESLSNVARHASASRVDVELTRSQSELIVTITDNGVGFDSEQPLHGSHGLGLLGMKERVALVHGELLVSSAVGKGTRVQVAVLVPEEEA